MLIDPIEKALELRKNLVREGKLLVADFSETLEGRDSARVVDLMPDVSNGKFLFRTKVNVKKIDPLAAAEYQVGYTPIEGVSSEEIEALVKREEFDFPLWFKHDNGFDIKRVRDYNLPFIFQVAGCNFHGGEETDGCCYCFVDSVSNDGKPGKGKSWLETRVAIESMAAAREKLRKHYNSEGIDLNIRVMRISGGEPTLALDWALGLWREIEKQGFDAVGQMDTNLSTGPVVSRFEREGIYEPLTLEKLAKYPVKMLTAFKGTDEKNLQDNVQATTTLEVQRGSFISLLGAGFDVYPMLYSPNPKTLNGFLEEMDRLVEGFSLRTHVGPIKVYGPTIQRLTLKARAQNVNPEMFIAQTKAKWAEGYEQSCEIVNEYLQRKYGVGYKDSVRSDVKLKLV